MLVSCLRPDTWTLHEEGQTYDLADQTALDYLRGGLATRAVGEVERAVAGPAETADLPAQRSQIRSTTAEGKKRP